MVIGTANSTFTDADKEEITITITDAAKDAFRTRRGRLITSTNATLATTCEDAAGNTGTDSIVIKVSR